MTCGGFVLYYRDLQGLTIEFIGTLQRTFHGTNHSPEPCGLWATKLGIAGVAL